MKDFAAIDFETANNERTSVCSVGVVFHQLHTVATACGYQLENHHHALADAEACAGIAREIL